jgi:hypothetical protein
MLLPPVLLPPMPPPGVVVALPPSSVTLFGGLPAQAQQVSTAVIAHRLMRSKLLMMSLQSLLGQQIQDPEKE